MWRYKIFKFKERHLVVIALNFAETLGDSCQSSILSFMSAKHTIVEICNTSCFEPNLQEVII